MLEIYRRRYDWRYENDFVSDRRLAILAGDANFLTVSCSLWILKMLTVCRGNWYFIPSMNSYNTQLDLVAGFSHVEQDNWACMEMMCS